MEGEPAAAALWKNCTPTSTSTFLQTFLYLRLMKVFFTLIFLQAFVVTALGQTIAHYELAGVQDGNGKIDAYRASDGNFYKKEGVIYIVNYDNANTLVASLTQPNGKKVIPYGEVAAEPLEIYKVRLDQNNGDTKAYLIVFNIETLKKYRLDVEMAIRNNHLALEDTASFTGASLPTLSQNTIVSSTPSTSSLLPREEISKEMLLLSAIELKKYTQGYNRSLLLFGSGALISSVAASGGIDEGATTPLNVLGIGLMLGGSIQGVFARQHIGRSGAYLEAAANGVRIRF